MTTTVLQARGLTKRYGHVTALDGADFDLLPGEILAVIGDNGAGKSTLIKALSGALIPDEGEIHLDGKPVKFHGPSDARKQGIETDYQDLAVAPATMKTPPYDPTRAFTPIIEIARGPYVWLVRADQPAKSFQEFVAWAKGNPGKLN